MSSLSQNINDYIVDSKRVIASMTTSDNNSSICIELENPDIYENDVAIRLKDKSNVVCISLMNIDSIEDQTIKNDGHSLRVSYKESSVRLSIVFLVA